MMLLNQNTEVRRFLDPKVDIGDVSIRIRLFAVSLRPKVEINDV